MKHLIVTLLFISLCPLSVFAGNGHELWLRYVGVGKAEVSVNKKGETLKISKTELLNFWQGGKVKLQVKRSNAHPDSYTITGNTTSGIVITSPSEQGVLYGTYHLLRLQSTNSVDGELNITEAPSYDLRILNHWDNLDRTVERGYAGHSIWMWDELPEKISPRYHEYARANASIGINATVLNNVNATPQVLSHSMLEKVKVIADELRPYHVKVFLSINFSSPAELGKLPTSDPLNKQVAEWWQKKADEIYKLIPDFGGFLVKANSEGLPGPQDFGRTHADGANMLADALKPHGGIVMWRAFVYNPSKEDRAKQAYNEFMPLDGKFRDNVIIQVKNGPIDFQPREPFNPLFGGMQKTAVMPELQITQEYLGFSNHLVFLASMWHEFLTSDTYCSGEGSTVAKTTDGSLFPHSVGSAIAGVANIGEDENWTGHHFAQANWYSFGRLAWDATLTPDEIADEWIRQTFGNSEELVKPVKKLMLESYETLVSYMMPLGLHHIFAWNHHYGPEPWTAIEGARPDWLPSYYHNADSVGLGFDRTETGSDAVVQYFSPLKEIFNNISTCPEKFILWFHHVNWTYKMKNGRTMWNELCYQYDSGVKDMRELQKIWDSCESYVDAERFRQVQSLLKIQMRDAVWWKDACLLYFQTFSKMPIPYDIERPIHELDDLKKIKLDLKHHN
ncbi:MAG: alpha-glucuronidase [Culturomica sp.]|jgi:alpha-glucuronidase|nr:alpha-glucuronidase [Culturomica sp.]